MDKYTAYEKEKEKLADLTSEEYEKAVKELAEKYDV